MDAPGTSGAAYGEYRDTHNTQGQCSTWLWVGGMQQPYASPDLYTTPPMTWPGGFCPPISPLWFGWGMPYANPDKTGSASVGKNAGAKQHPSVADTGYNTVPIAALPYVDCSTPLGDHLTLAVKQKIWMEKYIDFYELLNRKVEVKDDENIKEKYSRKRPDRNWTNSVSYTHLTLPTKA